MSYKEPAVYLYQKNNAAYTTGVTPSLIPVIIGGGASQFKKTEAIKRGSAAYDILPSTAVASIATVGDTEGALDYVAITDFTFTPGSNRITWVTGKKHPDLGDVFYVTYNANAEPDQFEARLCSSYENDVLPFYGPEFKAEDSTICPVSL